MTRVTTLTDAQPGAALPVTPTDLIDEVRRQRTVADAAEVRILELAVEWAHAHPARPGDEGWQAPRAGFGEDGVFGDGAPDPEDPGVTPEEVEWFGIPEVRWDAPAAFAAANAMSTAAGRALIRDALVLRHRLPRVHARIGRGEVPAWRARRIAQAVLGAPRDVVAYVDQQVAPRADAVGVTTLERLLDEAMLRLYPEQREADQIEALDARHATLHRGSINHTGVAEMTLRGDWADLADFDDALSRVAAALGAKGCGESLDVRRSMAVGVLADPQRALALLTGHATPRPRKEIVAYVHLSDSAVMGLDPVGFDEAGRPQLEQAIRGWCGRTDIHLTVRPVIDLNDDTQPHRHEGHALDDYVPSAEDRERVWLRDRHCVFPFCTRSARRCDCDHRIPFDRAGPTCECNLAPLCRHHHRLKTHAGWRYTVIEPGVYLWSDPHGQQFLRDRDGTRDVTSHAPRPVFAPSRPPPG